MGSLPIASLFRRRQRAEDAGFRSVDTPGTMPVHREADPQDPLIPPPPSTQAPAAPPAAPVQEAQAQTQTQDPGTVPVQHVRVEVEPETYYNPVVLRDTGLKSRTFREAVEVIAEAAPTLPGLQMFLDRHGFRTLGYSVRDVNEEARLNILQRAEIAGTLDALGTRALQIRTDLIVSEGFNVEPVTQIKEYRDAIQRVIDAHWKLNQWEDRLYERIYDLGLTGEMFRRVPPLLTHAGRIKQSPGRFRCGNLIPQFVRAIDVDPWDSERVTRIHLQPSYYPGSMANELSLEIVEEQWRGANMGRMTGDAFYVAVNRRPGQSRGLSDLAPALDYFDLHSSSLFGDAERAALMYRFIWDVTMEKASDEQCIAYGKLLKANPPRYGTINVHNEKVKWEAMSPDLRMADTTQLREDIFLKGWGACGMPRHYFVEAEDTNRATGERMEGPTFAWARTRRRLAKGHLVNEHQLAVQVAADAGLLRGIPRHHLGVKCSSRDPDRSGYAAAATALKDTADALTASVVGGFCSQQDATGMFRTVAGTFGFELTPLEQIQAQQAANGVPENPLEQVVREAWDKMRRAPNIKRNLDSEVIAYGKG